MNEKFRRANRTQQQMDGFRGIVNYCGFQDLGRVVWITFGATYKKERIKSILDRIEPWLPQNGLPILER